MQRRDFVAAVGVSTAAGLAGCTGLLGGGGGPGGTARSATQAALNADVDRLDGLVHSESPLRPIREEDVGTGVGDSDSVSTNIQNVETVEQDPSEDTIRNQFGGLGTTGDDLDTVVQVANEAENAAVVEVTVEFTISANGQSESSTTTLRYLMATEDGSWTVVATGTGGQSNLAAPF